jgi:sugar-specific transcriptional regulator TrmB/DNA-binding CsgD family transcriptional regulator
MKKVRSLLALGVSDAEERVYRHLLRSTSNTTKELASTLGVPSRQLQQHLDRLEELGLVNRSPERIERYVVVAPEFALESLYLQRNAELQQARSVIADIEKEAKSGRRQAPQQLVELIKTQQAARQAFDQMQRSAEREVVWLVRPPMIVSRLDQPMEVEQALQRRALESGVRYRSIVDEAFLELPGAAQGIKGDMDAGEEVRVVSSLPLKMALADRKVALIPLNPGDADSQVLLVRSSALLDALYAMFELLWERATPLVANTGSSRTSRDPSAAALEEANDMLNLMAAGMNDKSIATKLRISTRTLNRRFGDLMDVLGTRSRFQTAWLAATKAARKK